tara:strand:- start:24404 stop:24637 length:234 start_codon:yes stop_codon:yes gene_type:complete
MNKIRKPIADWLLSKTFSKKLTVMIITSIALFKGFIDGDNFVWIASVYIGIEGGVNYLEYLASKKTDNSINYESEER